MYNTDMLISVVAVAMNDGNESNSTESGISMIGSVVATSDVVVFDDAVVASEVVDVDVEVNGVGSGIVAVAVRMGVVMLSVGAADEAAVGGVGGVAVGGSVAFVEFVGTPNDPDPESPGERSHCSTASKQQSPLALQLASQ